MTVTQFKKWLESRIAEIREIDDPWEPELLDIAGYRHEAYERASDLGLVESMKVLRRKQPHIDALLAAVAAIPEPTIKQVYKNQQEAADRLGLSRRTIKRLVDDDDLECNREGIRYTFTEEQIQAYLAGEESESLFG